MIIKSKSQRIRRMSKFLLLLQFKKRKKKTRIRIKTKKKRQLKGVSPSRLSPKRR